MSQPVSRNQQKASYRLAKKTYRKERQEARKQFKEDKRLIKTGAYPAKNLEKISLQRTVSSPASQNQPVSTTKPAVASRQKQKETLEAAKKQYHRQRASLKKNYGEQLADLPADVLSARDIKRYQLPQQRKELLDTKEQLASAKRTRKIETYLSKQDKKATPKKADSPFQVQQVSIKRSDDVSHPFSYQKKENSDSFVPTAKQHLGKKKQKSYEELLLKKRLKASKKQLKQTKSVFRYKKPSTKVKRLGKSAAGTFIAVSGDDTEGASNLQEAYYRTQAAKRSLKTGKKVIKGVSVFTYHRGKNTIERTNNLLQGRGWRLNDPKRHINQRLKAMMKRFYRGLLKSPQTIRNLPQFLKAGFKDMLLGVKLFVTNPLVMAIGLGVMALLLLLSVAVFSILQTPVTSDEFDTNDAWVYLSKLDREKSDDKVVYYSDIDSYLTYMGYVYGDWKLTDKLDKGDYGFVRDKASAQEALDTLWQAANGNYQQLKTVKQLYSSNPSFKLDDEARADYEELLDNSKELGHYQTSQDLGNPFYGDEDEKASQPLTVIKRYGYDTATDFNDTTTLSAPAGQSVLAVMDGSVKIDTRDGKQVLAIVSKEGDVFYYYDLDGIRVADGQTIQQGEQIGRVSSHGDLEVAYVKFREKGEAEALSDYLTKGEAGYTSNLFSNMLTWFARFYDNTVGKATQFTTFLYNNLLDQDLRDRTKLMVPQSVNPAFYWAHVTYAQKTYVISDVDGDVMARLKAFYDNIKKAWPNATDEGIAAMLGNFWVESKVTAKRYEADSLNQKQYDKADEGGITAENLFGSWGNFLGLYGSGLNEAGYLSGGNHWIGAGLGQWTGARSQALYNFAKGEGKKWYDLDVQVAFLTSGDNAGSVAIAKSIATAHSSVESLTTRFLTSWEGINNGTLGERIGRAQEALQAIKNGFPGASGGGAIEGSGQPLNVPYTITQAFGRNANGGGANAGTGHTGMDLAAPQGSPIFAVTDGKVVSVNTESPAINGNYVMHTLPDGTIIYYGHMLATPLVKVGDTVKQGQLLGYVGATGLASGPHVHFERRQTIAWANFLDPAPLILKDGKYQVGQVVNPSEMAKEMGR